MIVCPHCNTINKDGIAFCVQCGKKLITSSEQNTCIACGATLKAGAKFCARCGTQQTGDDKPESKSDATVIIPRKDKTPPVSQADVETVMVIEDRPSHKSTPAPDKDQTVIITKPKAQSDKQRDAHSEPRAIPSPPAALSTPPAPPVSPAKKSGEGQTSTPRSGKSTVQPPTQGKSGNTAKAVGIGVIAALVIGGGGIYLFKSKQPAPASPPTTEASAPQVDATPTAPVVNSAPVPAAPPAEVANSQPVSIQPVEIVPATPGASAPQLPADAQPAPPPCDGGSKQRKYGKHFLQRP